jgi:hypothetical protein
MPFRWAGERVASRLSAALQTALAGTLLPAVQLLVCAVRVVVLSRSATAKAHAIGTLSGWMGMELSYPMAAAPVENNR